MKTLLLSIAALAVVTAPVFGEDEDKPKPPPKRVQPPPQHVQPAPQRQVNTVPRSYTPRVQQQLNARTNAVLQNRPTVTARTYRQNQDASVNASTRLTNPNWYRNRYRTNPNVVTNQAPNTNIQANTNTTMRNRDWQNRTTTNRNWQNNNTAGTFTFEQARRHFNRERHDRSWWRSHYNRIVLFGGGYYYWDNNYWYPAYGYDPYYSTYAYDEPIYGYNDLPPGQVIANVQAALQEQGYYNDAVDGLIGPNTRAALSNFQRDQGLPITAAIDGPTLQALGLA
ncbi:MAG TPA: peptidoglycan-binding protein [Chthoniobacterales bacterium]